ncbi:MAG TPA: isocitrate/isopropylmalate family dehydrogenase, partial [Candidatus Omnitrophota bacterium]|nr:isocitrate/isopropylmalate family dehydrogenase [Candidatus Omnitrophota bacterium]
MHKIAIIPGDGTGPEVVAEAVKVLDAAGKKFGFQYESKTFDYGGERYLKTGKTIDDDDVRALKQYSAILLGAIGHPDVKPGILETGILLKLRFALDQYINLRPVKLYDDRFCPLKDKKPADIDFVVVRENSEGIYKGLGEFQRKGAKDEVAIQISHNTRKGVERCIRYAFDLARNRKRKKLTLCGKTNVLTYAWDLWQRVFDEVKKEYPDVTTDYAHV